ncbi:MAG: 3-oxocholest-4-en-26-oyl-CoA dehydrogenase beta subunit [Actinomycetota bacterium]|jgi:acyl-CoA dehydrogenase
MDFDFSDEQLAVRDLANQIFDGMVTVDRIKAVEATDDGVDHDLWAALAKANLLGLCLPEAHGGSGLGMVELCLLLEAQGRRLAPVPLLATIALGALPLARFGSAAQQDAWLPGVASGDVILTAGLVEPGSIDPTKPRTTATVDGVLHGFKLAVPAGHVAARVLIPATRPDGSVGVYLVDPAGTGVERERVGTTDRQGATNLVLDGAPGELIDGADVAWIRDRALVGLSAMQYGVAQEALRLAAEYTSGRLQFGKPLSTFQGVSLRAADAYIDTSAIAVTLWQAAWRLDEGLDASKEIAIAKWWAAEGGERVVHATQHLHGGMGADVDYPVHRYFLWGKQIADTLGGASGQLARLGAELADAYR